jgi:hypothetical protein
VRERIMYSPRPFNMKRNFPDLTLLEGAVSNKVIAAMKAASIKLKELGIPHLLVGGLAVSAWGYPRGSKDVDFLTGEAAFEQHEGAIVTFASGVPILVGSVVVDYISVTENEDSLRNDLERSKSSAALEVITLEGLIYLKLKAGRRKDQADIEELMTIHNPEPVRRYLQEVAPEMVDEFDSIVRGIE